MIQHDQTQRLRIPIRSLAITSDDIEVTEFMHRVDTFVATASDDNEVVVSQEGDYITVIEVELETQEEYDKRIADQRAYQFNVQQEADNSWKRQQAKFARSRRKKSKENKAES